MSGSTLILLALAIPAAAALLIPLFHRLPNVREAVTLLAAGLLVVVVYSIVPLVFAGEVPMTGGLEVMPGVVIAFSVEPLGMIFACVASTLWIVNSIYSIGYMRGNNEPRQTSFYVCFAVALSSTMGIAFSDNLFTIFLFYEILTLSTYPLVVHKGDDAARIGGRIYLSILLGTSMLLLLPAIIWTGALAGTLTFNRGGILPETVPVAMVGVLLLLFVYGIGKAAVMPIHFWLPAAMVAPTPVSALLHAVAVVKAGVFTVTKVVVYVFGVDYLVSAGTAGWMMWLAGFTVIAASLVALRQDNLKKRLAYSTVSQLSYVVLAAAILAPLSLVGAAVHIAAHAVSKITLFFAAGSVYTAAHVTEVSQMNGIGRRMPWTMGAFAIGALSMIGVPPTAGFLSKWFILSGAYSAEAWLAVGVIVLSTALNAAYFLPIVYTAFARKEDEGYVKHHGDHGEAPLPIVIALTATAAGTILLFLFPGPLVALAESMVGIGQ
ncbi:proton-conducting transporter membrane subunit [Microbaculum marinisediminis]|uniref:Monovalent cation/H+ antiporter subunit D family protein n=1 Tax=Microbaculum marinisediminis TaxID=2931392 RepID=A0AAW5QU90_9HYPH|nr:proton-conducting transporter membrane subunit [Microbaculum sp. A6E488]MCT8971253.1 monovalent cation/H+ antiporter subunit D family protein [Microbaculum sp. A6E488]